MSTPSPKRPPPSDEHQQAAARIFAHFTTRYGRAWTNRFEGNTDLVNAALYDWADGIRTYSLEAIRYALDKVDTAFPKYPPSRGEFMGMCWTEHKAMLERAEAVTSAKRRQRTALPRPAHTDFTRQQVANIRKILR